MAVKVAINGFGRIGRNILRAIVENGRTDIEVVAINDLGPVETNAHLLRYDSVHGRFPGTVTTTESTIDVGRGPIEVTAIRNPADLPWGHVDIVWNAPASSPTRTRRRSTWKTGRAACWSPPLQGRRQDHRLRREPRHAGADDPIVSNASCTTNCLAPVAHVLNRRSASSAAS
jgi:glyceraldehyde 3-phosphate dehydrogenase